MALRLCAQRVKTEEPENEWIEIYLDAPFAVHLVHAAGLRARQLRATAARGHLRHSGLKSDLVWDNLVY